MSDHQAQAQAGMSERNPIVGHKTFATPDGGFRHEPLRLDEAEALLAAAEAAKAKRAADMPTEEDAARAMWSAWQRLKELGWRETCYGPTGVTVRLIEPGSSGIHQGQRWKAWPEKTWWIDGDSPSNPCLFKPLTEDALTPSPTQESAAASLSPKESA